MRKPERQTNCSSETDVGGIRGSPLFAGDGVCCDSGTLTTHYTFSGEKIMVEMAHNSDDPDVDGYLSRLYLGGMELEHTNPPGGSMGDFVPMAYYFGDGRYLYKGERYQYYLHDHSSTRLTNHLGNTVVLFEDKDGDGEIRQTTDPQTNEVIDRYHYYSRRDIGYSQEEPIARPNPAEWGDAFGLRWEVPEPYELGYIDENHYRYNSKEWDRISEWYDYGWRWYDPVIGRFGGVDPIADQFPHVCPFNYAENEPIAHIDLWGLQKYYAATGEFIVQDGNDQSLRVMTSSN